MKTITTASVALAILSASWPALARDPAGQWATSPWKAWFDAQHDLNNRSCCLWADGHFYNGSYVINPDGSVTIKDTPTGPVTLPKSQVLLWGKTELSDNPTGQAIWWWTQAPTLAFSYCFALRQPLI